MIGFSRNICKEMLVALFFLALPSHADNGLSLNSDISFEKNNVHVSDSGGVDFDKVMKYGDFSQYYNVVTMDLPGVGVIEFVRDYAPRATVSGNLVWSAVALNENAAVKLYLTGGKVTAGRVSADGRFFEILVMDTGRLSIQEVFDYQSNTEIDYVVDFLNENSDVRRRDEVSAAAANSTIRILSIYTNDVKNSYGDNNAINDLEMGFDDLEMVLKNNQVDTQIKLQQVAVEHIPYDESSTHNEIINDMESSEYVADMRRYYGADIVSVLVKSGSGIDPKNGKTIGVCGMANLRAVKSTAFFTVKYSGCNNYVFAHEFGHILGADHNVEDTSNKTGYNHGFRYLDYVNPNNNYRTVMSYQCAENCPRKGYFSTPDQKYKGITMGNSSSADNERQLINYAPTSAAFYGAAEMTLKTPALSSSNAAFQCYGHNNVWWTEKYGDKYELYRSKSSNMSYAKLEYSGTDSERFVRLKSASDYPYVGVKTCKGKTCTGYSNIKKLSYLNYCM